MNFTADVCIIGAGPAGSLLASSLSDREHDVLVLDAGPRFDTSDHLERMERFLRPGFERREVWDMGGDRDAFSLSGPVEYALNNYRVKGVGGSTLCWRATAMRLHPEDFEMQSRYGLAHDWPISYEDLVPYYRTAERELGVSGQDHPFAPPRDVGYPLPAFPSSRMDDILADAFASVGAELHPCPRAINSIPYDNRSECVGYGTCSPVCPSGAKYSANVHADRAEDTGARIVDRAPVQRLNHDNSGERITEVVAIRDGEELTVSADIFVIAAGGVETPRLLLLSESEQHPDGLANGSGRVGHYFSDHNMVGLLGRVDQWTGSDQIGFETSISEAYYPHDRGPEGSVILMVDNVSGRSPPTVALTRRSNTAQILEGDPVSPLQGDAFGDELFGRLEEDYEGRVRIEAMIEPLPNEENRVTLDESNRDTHDNPVPDIDYTIDDTTQRTLEETQSLLWRIAEEAGVYDIEPVGSPTHPHFVSHQMGTTRMGTDSSESVVDANLRTHELDNLYISSAGTFVTFGASPPTVTIAALTLRLADHLHEQLAPDPPSSEAGPTV